MSALNRTGHYNSLVRIHKQALQLQTNYTPNVLGIYLLSRVLSDTPGIGQVAQRIRSQARAWYELFEHHPQFQPFVPPGDNRSDTVVHLRGEADLVQAFKQRCTQGGITIGSGYGPHKATGLRIANFPAHTEVDISRLRAVFEGFGG
jgi:phosphoserine aminotransferase